MTLDGKTILITGSAKRLGLHFALTVAHAGANVILHHAHSQDEAQFAADEITRLGRKAWIIQADLGDLQQAQDLIEKAWGFSPIYGLVNNAAIFEPLKLADTTLTDWQRHLDINLTAPFLLCQSFKKFLPESEPGRIINILDWRALRPGRDHFPYTISKAALAALTKSLALVMAPQITVNGLALGAILPPSDGSDSSRLVKNIPAGRWANLDEVGQALNFLLEGPAYITGEIIHVDGGRHLV